MVGCHTQDRRGITHHSAALLMCNAHVGSDINIFAGLSFTTITGHGDATSQGSVDAAAAV